MACVLVPLLLSGGGITLNVTPGGTESGAEPIFEKHGDVVVKVLGPDGHDSAGCKRVIIGLACCIQLLFMH